MQIKDIDHISEKDFSDVCQEYAKEHKNLTFCPAEWEWEAYPDVGFAILTNGNYTSITWGHHRYTRMSFGMKATAKKISFGSKRAKTTKRLPQD